MTDEHSRLDSGSDRASRSRVRTHALTNYVKFGIVYDDRYEFRDGAPAADGVLLLDELAMMLYDAMDFASETGSLQGLSTVDMW